MRIIIKNIISIALALAISVGGFLIKYWHPSLSVLGDVIIGISLGLVAFGSLKSILRVDPWYWYLIRFLVFVGIVILFLLTE